MVTYPKAGEDYRTEPGSGPCRSVVVGVARQSGDLGAAVPAIHGEGAAPVQGSHHIMLVEDDPFVRDYASAQLVSLGYQVTQAASGRAALAILAQREDIDLLLTDVMMPGGMNGYALALNAQKMHPGLKVLFTSGCPENGLLPAPSNPSKVALLGKPYRRAGLALAVKAALE